MFTHDEPRSVPTQFDGSAPAHERATRVRWTGGSWLEGPAWCPLWNSLLFSDIPANRVWRLDVPDDDARLAPDTVSIWRQSSGFANGRTVLPDGRVVQCEHGGRGVRRYNHDGSDDLIAATYDGKRLNSPNDLAWHPDGSVWFTDPTYGVVSELEGHHEPLEQDGSHVYRIDADGTVTRVADDFGQPNGLAFSVDFRTLYIADSDRGELRRFRVDGATLSGGDVIATVQGEDAWFDGLRVDEDDTIWVTQGRGIRLLTGEGEDVALWHLPRHCSNLEFGGARGNTVFVTATDTVYSLRVGVRGARWAGRPSRVGTPGLGA